MIKSMTNYYLTIFIIFSSIQIFSQSPDINELFFDYLNPSFSKDYFLLSERNKLSDVPVKLDSIISTSINGGSLKLLFNYNNEGKLSEWLISTNTESGWFSFEKTVRFYDDNNNVLTEIELTWINSRWDTSFRSNYIYQEGNNYHTVRQHFSENSWINLSRSNYEFSPEGNHTATLTENWENGEWKNKYLMSVFYNDFNLGDSTIFRIWNTDQWLNDRKTIFYYNENGIDQDSLVVKRWNGIDWENSVKREIANDENHNQIEQVDEFWDKDTWQYSIGRYLTYNEFNLLENVSCELWYNNGWVPGDGDIVFDGPDGFKIGFITNNLTAYYSTVVGVEEDPNSNYDRFNLSQNYPNPFNPTTTIKYEIPTPPRPSPYQGEGDREGLFVSLIVYDILGREIKTLVNEYQNPGSYEIEFNAGKLPSGIYFYRLEAVDLSTGSGQNFIETKRMILLK